MKIYNVNKSFILSDDIGFNIEESIAEKLINDNFELLKNIEEDINLNNFSNYFKESFVNNNFVNYPNTQDMAIANLIKQNAELKQAQVAQSKLNAELLKQIAELQQQGGGK